MTRITYTSLDIEGTAKALTEEATTKLETLNLGIMTAFLCNSPDRGDITIVQRGVSGGSFVFENVPGTDHTVGILGIEQVAEVLADATIEKLATTDYDSMTAHRLQCPAHGGEFFIVQGIGGDAIVIQRADVGESTHDHARAILAAA